MIIANIKNVTSYTKYLMIIILLLLLLGNKSLLFPQSDYENKVLNEKYLFIDSDMNDTKVFINDSLYGTTPMYLDGLASGIYNVKFVNDTSIVLKSNVEYDVNTFRELFALFNKNSSLISVLSDPIGSEVFLNDSLIGVTPLYKITIHQDVYNLKIKKDEYFQYETRLLARSSHYRFNKKLKFMNGYLNLSSSDKESIFKINNTLAINNNDLELSLLR